MTKNEVWLLEIKMERDEDVREGDSDGEKFGLGKNVFILGQI